MYYTNELTITMANNEMATKALEILVKREVEGFVCDKEYRTIPSLKMAQDLEVKDNTIVLPEESGYYELKDAEKVFTEIIRELAVVLKEEFSSEVYNSGNIQKVF